MDRLSQLAKKMLDATVPKSRDHRLKPIKEENAESEKENAKKEMFRKIIEAEKNPRASLLKPTSAKPLKVNQINHQQG
jgi:hypothetical protein